MSSLPSYEGQSLDPRVSVWTLVTLRRKAFLKISNCCFLAPMGLTIPHPPFFLQTGDYEVYGMAHLDRTGSIACMSSVSQVAVVTSMPIAQTLQGCRLLEGIVGIVYLQRFLFEVK